MILSGGYPFTDAAVVPAVGASSAPDYTDLDEDEDGGANGQPILEEPLVMRFLEGYGIPIGDAGVQRGEAASPVSPAEAPASWHCVVFWRHFL